MGQTAVAHKPQPSFHRDGLFGHEWVVRPDGQVLLILSSDRSDLVSGARLSYRIDDQTARFDGLCVRFDGKDEVFVPFDHFSFSIRHRLSSALRLQGRLLILHCDLSQPEQGLKVKSTLLDPTTVSRH